MAHPDLHNNFHRSFWFLQLAIEQLRQHDPSLADLVKKSHLDRLRSLYDNYIANVHLLPLGEHDKSSADDYSRISNDEFQSIIRNDMPAPPGLGNGIRHEARPRVWSETSSGAFQSTPIPPNAFNHLMSKPPERSTAQFGAIGGERKTSVSSASHPSRTLSMHLEHARPDPVHEGAFHSKIILSPTAMPYREYAVSGTGTTGSSELSSPPVLQPLPSQAFALPWKEKDKPQQNTAMAQNHPKPVAASTTWASIAAIPKSSGADTKSYGGHVTTSGLTNAQKRLIVPGRGKSHDKTIVEAPEELSRAVWIDNLPLKNMTLKQVSSKITEGALFSLNICASPFVAGAKAACAIFRSADSAAAFIEGKKDAFGPKTSLIPGDYALNPHIVSMDGPIHCRRRVKWARSKLFHDVSLARFKMDVLKVAGGAGVLEQIHFYNPGEATAVFASVVVAKQVVRRFRKRTVKKNHRYAGVECGFCHDFNEAPATLWTQFDSSGKLRHNRFDGSCGIEGLFSGPSVSLDQDNEGLSDEEFEEGEYERILEEEAALNPKEESKED